MTCSAQALTANERRWPATGQACVPHVVHMDHSEHVNMSKEMQPGLGMMLADLTWRRSCAKWVSAYAMLVVLTCVAMTRWRLAWVIETPANVILKSQPDVS